MTEHQHRLFEKARRALEGARANLDRGDAEIVVNRAYYACYYAATAALLGVEERPRTHAGVLVRFRLHFVKEGPLDPSLGDLLALAYNARQRADYDAFTVADLRAGSDLLGDAERFVEAVHAVVLSRDPR